MVAEAMEVLKEYGWGAAFFFIYLTTVGSLIWVLMKDKAGLIKSIEKERDRTMAMAKIVQAETDAKRELSQSMKDLTASVREEIQQQAANMAYFKGRDEFQRGRRRG